MKKRKEIKINYIFQESKPRLEASLNFLTKNFRENFEQIKKEGNERSGKNITQGSFPETAVGIAPSVSGKGSRSNEKSLNYKRLRETSALQRPKHNLDKAVCGYSTRL